MSQPHYIPPEKTTATAREVFGLFAKHAPDLDHAGLVLLVAHWGLETGDGAAMKNWNIGGAKAKIGGPTSWTFFTTQEVLPPATSEKWLADPRVSFVRVEADGRVRVKVSPDHPACCFRAYESLDDACRDHVEMMRSRFPVAFAVLGAATFADTAPLHYAQALAKGRYFTADPGAYARALVGRFVWYQNEAKGWTNP